MTHDKVRQDFEAWYYAEYGIKAGVFSLGTYHNRTTQRSFEAYQAGRAAERAEIREKLESEGVTEDIASVMNPYWFEDNAEGEFPEQVEQKKRLWRSYARKAITKILEVI